MGDSREDAFMSPGLRLGYPAPELPRAVVTILAPSSKRALYLRIELGAHARADYRRASVPRMKDGAQTQELHCRGTSDPEAKSIICKPAFVKQRH